MENQAIIMNPTDAELFKEFIENYENFKTLKEGGVFEVPYGNAEIIFSAGLIHSIKIVKSTYLRVKTKTI